MSSLFFTGIVATSYPPGSAINDIRLLTDCKAKIIIIWLSTIFGGMGNLSLSSILGQLIGLINFGRHLLLIHLGCRHLLRKDLISHFVGNVKNILKPLTQPLGQMAFPMVGLWSWMHGTIVVSLVSSPYHIKCQLYRYNVVLISW